MSQNRKIVQLEDFSKELGNFSKKSLAKKQKAVVAGVAASIPALVAASPVDTGAYASSWDFTVLEQSVILGNYAPYAGVIEYGARPFTPPIGPLLAWAKRVSQSSAQPPDYDSQCWALAKYVQKKISREGMKPQHIMEKMIPTIIDNIRQELKII
jgi:hypothetical protein